MGENTHIINHYGRLVIVNLLCCCHTYPRSRWRSHCDLISREARVKRSVVSENDLAASQGRKRVPMSYLERRTSVPLRSGSKQAQLLCVLMETV